MTAMAALLMSAVKDAANNISHAMVHAVRNNETQRDSYEDSADEAKVVGKTDEVNICECDSSRLFY